MMNDLLREYLVKFGHLVETELLRGKDPVTNDGIYTGYYQGNQYTYRVSWVGQKPLMESCAKSRDLGILQENYVKLYKATTQNVWIRSIMPETNNPGEFWNEETDEDCKKLVQLGAMPSEEDFIKKNLKSLI